MAEIPVNPDVLKWARTLRGLSLIEAADRLEVPLSELEAYESGSRRPTIGTLQRMATRYQINYVSLFMPQPLKADVPDIPDRRTRREHESKELSLETRVVLQEVSDTLDALADLKQDVPELFASVARLEPMLRNESAHDLANRQRSRFGVTIRAQREWPSDAYALRAWRNAIEHRGVFVYLESMGDECSGATIEREGLYAIVVNDAETNNGARIFTMFHEYCHVLRRQTAISDERKGNPVERYCNVFAADFLVPFSALDNVLGAPTKRRDFDVNELGKLARSFKVSLAAMAIRLEEGGWAKDGTYEQVFAITRKRVKKTLTGEYKINPITQQARRLGRRHTEITLEALSRGAINRADAKGLLKLDPGRFSALKVAVR